MRAALQLGGETVDGNPGTNLHGRDGQASRSLARRLTGEEEA